MARSSKASFLGLLIVAGTASATTLGPINARPATGRPLEVNIPFTVDAPTERACASANVRFGKDPVPGSTLHVQGQGLKRNLLVTSRAAVNGPTVSVAVRVGCGAKAVARTFTLRTNTTAAKSPRPGAPATRLAASALRTMSGPKAIGQLPPGEPLFPPDWQAAPRDSHAPAAGASVAEEVRQARTDAATAMAQLDAARRELAAILDVERRTSQTLIDADHEVREAKSEVARMRVVLNLVATGLALAAAGLLWLQFSRIRMGRRPSSAQPAQEPTLHAAREVRVEPAADRASPGPTAARADLLGPGPLAAADG